MADWLCESCIHNADGKPCCSCVPEDPVMSCYCRKDGADNETISLCNIGTDAISLRDVRIGSLSEIWKDGEN